MNRPANSSKPSLPLKAERPWADSQPFSAQLTRAAALKRLAGFGFCIVVTSLILSGLVRPLVDLPWWKTFRRCVSISAAVTLWIFMRFLHRQPLRSLGLGSWKLGRRQLVHGVLLGCAAVLLIGSAYLLTGACRISVTTDQGKLWRTLIGFLPAAGLIGVLEELVFRGYVFQLLLAFSTRVAIAGSSLLYALVHVRPNWAWPGSGLELMGLFILGCLLAISYLRTRQLYLAIGLHAGLAYWARINKLLVEFTEPSLAWLVGTNRLVNGIVGWFALLGIGLVVARRARAESA
jgi:membrane protease YdiL (CAAX protease family)